MKQINKQELYLIRVALNRLLLRFSHEQDYYKTICLRGFIINSLDCAHIINDELLNERLSDLQNCLFKINNDILCPQLKKAMSQIEKYLVTRTNCDFIDAIECSFYGVK